MMTMCARALEDVRERERLPVLPMALNRNFHSFQFHPLFEDTYLGISKLTGGRFIVEL